MEMKWEEWAKQFNQANEDKQIEQQIVRKELSCLVCTQGWLYVRSIAKFLLASYECPPPINSEDKEKWESYTRTKWAIDKLLTTVESLGGPEAPLQKKRKPLNNADNRPPTRKPKSSTNRRATSRK
jgi:hypothetical protein